MADLACHDCGTPYEDPAWLDTCIPADDWAAISPTGGYGGILCILCMAKRLVAAGRTGVPLIVGSGPYAHETNYWWQAGWDAGRGQAATDIRAHADRHAPADGNEAQRSLRRHLEIAERVALGPLTEADYAEIAEQVTAIACQHATRTCQVPDAHGRPVCVRTMAQRPCGACAVAPAEDARDSTGDEITRADVDGLVACVRTRDEIPDGYVCSACGWGDLAHPATRTEEDRNACDERGS